jgi:hypothetical protein
MKKLSTAAVKQTKNFPTPKLTIARPEPVVSSAS